jgi:ribosomal protein S18 acetylase RimI-like enzyme
VSEASGAGGRATAAADARVRVREALPGERAAAGEVVARAYATIPGGSHGDYLDHVRDVDRRARHCTILVAVDDAGRILGSVSYVPGPGNPYAESEREGEAGFRMLGVAPEARGRGVGEALVRACVERAAADGRTAIVLSSTPEMTDAHRLYRRLGFERAPERDFDPVPGVRLLVFVRGLAAR